MGSLFGGGKGQSTPPPPPVQDNTADMMMMMQMMQSIGGGGGGGVMPAPPPQLEAPDPVKTEVVDWKQKQVELHEKMAEQEKDAAKKRTGRKDTILTRGKKEAPETTTAGILG